MADDRSTPPSMIDEPGAMEDTEEKDEDRENCCESSDGGRSSDDHHREEEGSSGYFSRMLQKTIGGGDDLESRIEMIGEEEESLESRMIIRERTAEQVNRSMIFLSVNLEVSPHPPPHSEVSSSISNFDSDEIVKFVVCGGNLCISEGSIEEFELERESYSDLAYVSSTGFSLFFLFPLLSLHKHAQVSSNFSFSIPLILLLCFYYW